MKLSADEMFEISTAMHCGLKEADLQALSAAQRSEWLAAVRSNAERHLANHPVSESARSLIQESVELADRPDMLAERERERHYSRPAKERARELSGQKMALNDFLSQAHHFSTAQRAAIEARLIQRGLPGLRSLECVLKRTHERILKRGRIRTEEEYYLIREILADGSFEISDSDRVRFEVLSESFEGGTAK